MVSPDRIDRLARSCLVLALALAIFGKVLDHEQRLPFWGGLIAACGEAALVGGLADWFAVSALFSHPFGIPFPIVASMSANSALFLVPAIANCSGSPASHHTTSSAIRSRAASISPAERFSRKLSATFVFSCSFTVSRLPFRPAVSAEAGRVLGQMAIRPPSAAMTAPVM